MTVHATRKGKGTYIGRNENGASVRIGHGEGEFTPGELLQLALGACQALSADHNLSHFLSDSFAAELTVQEDKNAAENRYDALAITLDVNRGQLPEDRQEKLEHRVAHAIERQCTVGRTLDHGVEHTFTLK